MIDPLVIESKVRSKLQYNESLLWVGVPSLTPFTGEMIARTVVGVIPFYFSFLSLILMASQLWHPEMSWPNLPWVLVGLGISTIILLLGFSSFLSPWMLSWRLNEVVYAITDQRAFVLTSKSQIWNPVPAYKKGESIIEFSLDHLRHYQKQWRDFGRTDLIFHREWRKRIRGGGSWYYFGFFGLPNLEEPVQIIEQSFRSTNLQTQPVPEISAPFLVKSA